MKNPLFGIDIQMHKNSDTSVVFWRHDRKQPGTAIQRTIPVRTKSTRDRLREINNLENIISIHVWPAQNYLSIDFILKESPNGSNQAR